MSLIECVPNVSEGRRPRVIEALGEAIRRVEGVRLLDCSSDAAHNRAVYTFVGTAVPLRRAVLALYQCAVAEIDLRVHTGIHPRMGAVDVVPFVPLEGATMDDCVSLARETGAQVASQYAVPVFLYAEAASASARRHLENVRRGQFEGLAARMAAPDGAPDFGPSAPHPTAGASAIGARRLLVAYNVNLATSRLEVAKAVAANVRERGGGLPAVKALGLALPGRDAVQVSMNLTNYEQTPVPAAFEAVVREAARHGVEVLESEIIGLVPRAALAGVSPAALRIRGFTETRLLDEQLARGAGTL